MPSSKLDILEAIRSTAASNGGKPLGVTRFGQEAGIAESEWFGVYWARWGDALRDAGFEPNRLQDAFDSDYLLERFAQLAAELQRIPVKGDLKLKRGQDSSFPSFNVFARLGSKEQLLSQLNEFCRSRPHFAGVQSLCEQRSAPKKTSDVFAAGNEHDGYVYLLKHGNRREYKIGKTKNILRREGEIKIELPEQVRSIHTIKTDDPAGIEAYWHSRFAHRRKNGEWFELSSTEVAAFKRRKFM